MTELLLATTNPGKVREICGILSGLPVRLFTLPGIPPPTEVRCQARCLAPCLAPEKTPEETGRTFEENARLKARYYAKAAGVLTVAEDSGLEVDALGGAPGIESARFGGPDASYPEKFSLIYGQLRAKGEAGSTARFVCALAVADGERIVFEARGTVEGQIAPEPRGTGGFGYDPIFYYPPFGCTLAEAAEQKAEVSHRAKAFAALRRYLAGNPLHGDPPTEPIP